MVKTYDLIKDGELSLSNKMSLKVKEFRSYSSTYKKLYSNEVKISEELIALLEKLYLKMNCSKIIINTGYRCPAHNSAIGGSKNSQHLYGTAADVVFYNDSLGLISPKYVCCVASTLGFKGIGRMNTATHLDVRTSGVWYGDETKKENGTYYSLTRHGQTFFKYFGLTEEYIETLFKKDETETKVEDDEMVESLSVNIFGEDYKVNGIFKDNSNYISPKVFETAGFKVSNEGKKPIIDPNEVIVNDKKVSGFISNGSTYVKLTDICDLLGVKAVWNNDTKSIKIGE